MIRLPGTAGSPLFLRIFLLMLLCVGVVQLANITLLMAAQAPSQQYHTMAEIADAVKVAPDAAGKLLVTRVGDMPEASWSPRGERMRLAMGVALSVPPERIVVSFPSRLPVSPPRYDSATRPRIAPPPNVDAARDMFIVGDFVIGVRQPDGNWLRVSPGDAVEPWRWYALAWLLISILAVAPFAWTLARRFAHPFGAFAAAAERLGRDPRAPPLEVEGPPEIADAAVAFNRMQARLNRYVDVRATVTGALAHDLRTPLMRLALRLEQAPHTVRHACEADIREMQAMITAAVQYVRDTGELTDRRPLDLRSITESVIDEWSDRGGDVKLLPGQAVVMNGLAPALKAMIANLVSNAVKYAEEAEVSLGQEEDQVILEVRDRGPGLAPDDLAHVFEPFFRGERSRNRDTGGTGLGLPSARAVARAHGGDIEIDHRPGGGLIARVTLPL